MLAVTFLAISPAAGIADTWYAAPAGTGTECTQPNPCLVEQAVEEKATGGDEVVVLPGTHNVEFSSLTIDTGITVRGVSAAQRPTISVDPAPDTDGVEVTAAGAQLRDLRISSLGTGVALHQLSSSITAERVYVTQGDGLAACSASISGVLRDSVCFSTSTNGDAIRTAVGGAVAFAYRLVNVTAIATGAGTLADAMDLVAGSDANVTLTATNVIARGGGGVDVRADTGTAGSTATVALDHSNYATEAETGTGTSTVTAPGSGTNQMALPMFSPGLGNFHQAAGAPTIDMGTTNPLDGGPLDLDGEPRAQGAAQDIGADEYPSVSVPTGASSPGIAALLGASAKGKKILLTLSCPTAAGTCENQLVLKTAKPVQLGGASSSAKGKRILLGKASFSIPVGQTKVVTAPLTKLGRSLFEQRRRVKARATITGGGTSSTTALKIKAKRTQ